MDKSLGQLEQVMTTQQETYKALLSLTEKKTEVIKTNQIKELDRMTREEQDIVLKLGHLEKIRESIVYNMAENLGLDHEKVTMTQLLDHYESEKVGAIKDIKIDLFKTLETIGSKNQLNQILIKDSLEYIDFNLSLMTDAGSDQTYDKNSGGQSGGSRSFFEVKA